MPYSEIFDIVALRSRQHAFHLNQLIRNEGISTQLISTPRELSLGCGISIRFSPFVTQRVISIYKKSMVDIIGFFHIEKSGSTMRITRIPV